MVRPAVRREVARYLQQRYEVSERRACRTIVLQRATLRYRSCLDPRTALRIRMRDIAYTRVRYGYRRVRVLLLREGWKISKNLVYRVYREEGLALRTGLRRRRRAPVQRQARVLPAAPNQAWTLDFVCDQLVDGARFRALPVLDLHTRQCLAIEIGFHLRGAQVVATLEQLRESMGRHEHCSVTMVASLPQGSSISGRISTRCGSTSRDPASQPITAISRLSMDRSGANA